MALKRTDAISDGIDTEKSVIPAYAIGGLVLAVAIATDVALGTGLDPALRAMGYVLAISVAAAVAGPGPTVAVTVGAVAAFGLLPAESPPDGLAMSLIALVGLATTLTAGQFLRSRRQHTALVTGLRERQARLEAILETVPEAVIVIDEAGTIGLFSSKAEELFGYAEVEVVGKNVKVLMPDPYRADHDKYIGRYLETGEKRIIGVGRLVVGRRKDGDTFPLELAVGEIAVAGKAQFIGFIRDVTQRQKTEARLQELQSELVHISRVTAMGEMASALAHELNQPLSAIANYLKGTQRILERQEGDRAALGPVEDALAKATEQAHRAGEVIRKVRGFVGRSETERQPQRLSKLIEEAAALALVGAKELDVNVRFQIDPSIDGVLADRIQVQQLLINLIRNGVEAMADSPRRELVVSNAVHSDKLVRVEVTDTGSGITPEVAERLFEPFVTSKEEGMGIGLSISRAIAREHGGDLWATENPGGGTRFCLTLPIAPAGTDE